MISGRHTKVAQTARDTSAVKMFQQVDRQIAANPRDIAKLRRAEAIGKVLGRALSTAFGRLDLGRGEIPIMGDLHDQAETRHSFQESFEIAR